MKKNYDICTAKLSGDGSEGVKTAQEICKNDKNNNSFFRQNDKS